MSGRITFRKVDPREEVGVERVVCEAFGGTVEYRLVDQLRDDDRAWVPEWSIGAFAGDELVGHILFTRASVGGMSAALLAPLAVAPAAQGKGVGEELCRIGLEAVRASGATLALVLGHPEFYPRVGFEPAFPRGITPPHEVDPQNAWMVIECVPGALELARGVATVADAFMRPEMWRED